MAQWQFIFFGQIRLISGWFSLVDFSVLSSLVIRHLVRQQRDGHSLQNLALVGKVLLEYLLSML